MTGEVKIVGAPSLGSEGGVDIPASDVAPEEGEWWLDTSEDGETHEYAAKDLSNVPNEDLVAKLEESGFSGIAIQAEEPTGNEKVWIDLDDEEGVAASEMQMDLLWENASPTSEFAAQTITLDLSEYQYIYVYALMRTLLNKSALSEIIAVGEDGTILTLSTTWTLAFADRAYSVSTNDVKFADGKRASFGGSAEAITDNSMCIPIRIFGIKGIKDDMEVSA